ncbi:hypothetical protein Tco_0698917 [Tanacetum coccineum]
MVQSSNNMISSDGCLSELDQLASCKLAVMCLRCDCFGLEQTSKYCSSSVWSKQQDYYICDILCSLGQGTLRAAILIRKREIVGKRELGLVMRMSVGEIVLGVWSFFSIDTAIRRV